MPATTFQDEGKIVNPQTLVFKRAVKDAAQAYDICKSLLDANRDRANKEKLIMQIYNGKQPWPPSQLKAAKQGWRNNRDTGFFPTMISRVIPAYKQAITSAQSLTLSKLNVPGPDADQKTTTFRAVTSRTIRQWDEWENFCHQVIVEDIIFGYAANCWTDEWDWRPMFARTDDAIFPDGCPQSAKNCPIWMLRQRFQIHEMAEKLAKAEDAENMGWNIKNMVKAINDASPDQGGTKTQDDYRRFEDLVRESTVGTSYRTGTKEILAYHLFVQEANGMVTHYLLDGMNGNELFTMYDRYKSMDECLTLFSIEIGNGKLHGSKGAGRRLYNTHIAVEQARNLISDNLYLSSLILLKSSTVGKQQAAITVQHPICIVGERYEVVDQKFEVNVDAFFQLDRHLTSVAELQIGAFMPGQLLDAGGEKRTASEVNYVASVEQQIKEGHLRRFYGQFEHTVWGMQKRMYSVDNLIEGEAIYKKKIAGGNLVEQHIWEGMAQLARLAGQAGMDVKVEVIPTMREEIKAIVELLEAGLTTKEIYELAQCPSWESEIDLSSQNGAALDAVVARYAGNPNINQVNLTKRDISQKLGASVAKDLMIPAEDNTIKAEATRWAIVEDDAMLQGDEVPVSPRDMDVDHLDVHGGKLGKMMQTMTPESMTPAAMNIGKLIVQHMDEHVASAIQKGMKPDTLKQYTDFLKQAHELMDKMPVPQDPALASAPAGTEFAGAPTGAMAPAAGLDEPPAADDGMMPQNISATEMPLSRGPLNLQPSVTS